MEAIAAASSIAGLVSLAGQALDGILKLRGFFKDCAAASKTLDRFLRDLNSLIRTLEDVKTVVTRLQNLPTTSTFDNKAMISSLEIQLEDCSKDVYDWVRIASEQHSKFSKGAKAVFKQFVIAVKKEEHVDILREIGNHTDGLALKLSLIGRSLEIDHATSLHAMGARLEHVAFATTSSNRVTVDALQRLEAQLAVDRDALSETPSLRSLASSVSRIESMLSSQPASPASAHSSAHCSSAGGRRSPMNPTARRGSAASVGSNASSGGGRSHSSELNFRFQPSKAIGRNVTAPKGPLAELKKYLTLKTAAATKVDNTEQEKRDALWDPNDRWKPEVTESAPSLKLDDREKSPSEALLDGYEKFMDLADGTCPETLFKYINLVQFSRTISLHAKLLASIRSSQSHISVEQLRQAPEYQNVFTQLEILTHNIAAARKACWEEGYDLEEVDMILETDCVHDPPRFIGEYEGQSGEAGGDLAALQRRLEKLQASQSLSKKQDRINQWLLQKLISSDDEAILHRTFIEGGKDLGEQQWARLVLKFWPIDGAAIELERGIESASIVSTNEAIDSIRGCHSVKVLLELIEHASVLSEEDFLTEVAELQKRKLEVRRPISPLRENALFLA